jgi:hypothetical protein
MWWQKVLGWVVYLAVIGVMVVVINAFAIAGHPGWPTEDVWAAVVFMTILSAIAGVVMVVLGWHGRFVLGRTICPEEVVVDSTGNITLVGSSWIWIWQRLSCHIYKMKGQTFSLRLKPVTVAGGPKLRELRYWVTISPVVDGRLKDLLGSQFPDWQREAKRMLYDMNEELCRNLGKFFNPLREEQQQEFFALVSAWLAGKLSPGLRCEKARFGLFS